MIDPDQPLTLNDLVNGLELDLDFLGNDWGGPANDLTITIKFGDVELCKATVSVDPAGYVRENGGYS